MSDPTVIEVTVPTPGPTSIAVQVEAIPAIQVVNVPGQPGAKGETGATGAAGDGSDLPDLTLIFENQLI